MITESALRIKWGVVSSNVFQDRKESTLLLATWLRAGVCYELQESLEELNVAWLTWLTSNLSSRAFLFLQIIFSCTYAYNCFCMYNALKKKKLCSSEIYHMCYALLHTRTSSIHYNHHYLSCLFLIEIAFHCFYISGSANLPPVLHDCLF